MTNTYFTSITAAALLAIHLSGLAADPHAAHHHDSAGAAAAVAASTPEPATAKAPPDAAAYFTDLELQTQDGRKVRFYSDVLKGRTVLINVIYTSCTDACPLITQQLNAVRARLAPELFGQQVFFVSLSSDPLRDSPKALKAFARKQGADVDGWTFLTGRKENVDHILKKLGQYSETIEGHSTLLIAGNVPAKRWSKIRADAPAEAIAERLGVLALGADAPAVRP